MNKEVEFVMIRFKSGVVGCYEKDCLDNNFLCELENKVRGKSE